MLVHPEHLQGNLFSNLASEVLARHGQGQLTQDLAVFTCSDSRFSLQNHFFEKFTEIPEIVRRRMAFFNELKLYNKGRQRPR